MRRRIWMAVPAAIAMVLVLRFGRHLPWSQAGIVGMAVAALVYSIYRTADNLRGLYRRDD